MITFVFLLLIYFILPKSNDQDAPVQSLIEGGQMEELQTTMMEILEWLHIQGQESGKMKFFRRALYPFSKQPERVEKFSSELEKFKSAATLALSIGSRYAFQ